MKKALMNLGLLVSFFGTNLAIAHEMYHGENFEKNREEFKKMKLWCKENWSECKTHMQRMIAIREEFLNKMKECNLNSQNFGQFRECIKPAKQEMWKKMRALRQEVLEEETK